MHTPPDPLEQAVLALCTRHRDEATRTWQAGLLAQLRRAVIANLGGTYAGHTAPFERSLMDLKAFMLYEDLRQRAAGLYEMATDLVASAISPEQNLLGWFRAFDAARARGEISDTQERVALGRMTGWRQQIETYFDPPKLKELLAPCPRCGARYVEDDEARRSALYALIAPGVPVEAICRACGSRWRGESELVILSHLIGAAADA